MEAKRMGNSELLKEIRELEYAIENDFIDVSLSTLQSRQNRLNELMEEAEKRALKPQV
jgi:hypothetical protein